MGIRENLLGFLESIPENVQLVAVSKTKPNQAIQEAYDAGQRIFGENKVQDLVNKINDLPKDIKWHFIGHMQTNKVKLIAPFIAMIHAVDSIKLLKEINKHALINNRTIECLLQFHIAKESTKFGLNLEEAKEILNNPVIDTLKNIKIVGVMGMATYTDELLQIKNEFKQLATNFKLLKNDFFKDEITFKEISMGMSGDYKIAIDEGSTMIRIGTNIFGERNY